MGESSDRELLKHVLRTMGLSPEEAVAVASIGLEDQRDWSDKVEGRDFGLWPALAFSVKHGGTTGFTVVTQAGVKHNWAVMAWDTLDPDDEHTPSLIDREDLDRYTAKYSDSFWAED